MNKNYLLFTLMFISNVLLMTWSAGLKAQTATPPTSGDGSSGNPYQIATLENLHWISMHDWELTGKYFIQTSDIDASETATWYETSSGSGIYQGWIPIGGFTNTHMEIVYDGQGHVISNLYINRVMNYVGLFYFLKGEAMASNISNLGLTNVNITGVKYVGAIAGQARGDDPYTSSISNCYATGSVNGTDERVGGFIGWVANNCTIDACFSSCAVTGNLYVGGFIGMTEPLGTVTITESYATGDVHSLSGGYTGGFVGAHGNGTISNCYATGNVTADYSWVIGGFAGIISANAYNPDIVNSYSTGSVPSSGSYLGGFSGYGTNATDCFWDTQTSGTSSSYSGTGKTTTEMKTQSTFTNAGWDFSVIWDISPGINSGYPYLGNNAPPLPIITWTGTTSTDWNTATNWSTGIVPTSTDNVTIPDVANDPVILTKDGASCNNLNVNSGASLAIQSDGSLITNGSITNNGTINIERSISDGEWHLISMPNDNTLSNTFLADHLQTWTEDGQAWVDIVSTTTPLIPVQGYSLWGVAKNTTYTFTGTPNTGEQSFTLSYHNDDSKTADGMNLVGNPYPSTIMWGDLQPTYGAAYVWNPTTTNYITKTYGVIAPMQGFFIYTGTNGSSFTLQNTHRTHGGTFYKNKDVLSNGLVLQASYKAYFDEFRLEFDDNATGGFVLQDDAWKLISGYDGVSQLWSESPDGKLAIDKRPYQETIQLGFANNQHGIYSIGISEIADIQEAMLEDTKTNTFHNLHPDSYPGGAYEFTWNPDLDVETRFKLHLNAVGIEETPITPIAIGESDILIYAANGQIFIKGAECDHVMVSDIMGRIVLQKEISASELTVIPANLKTGVYLVIVTTGIETKSEKVFIK
ncbi:MAG: DUF6383 domain-containing protein [Bacteroidales bacterium]|nr:DUF6383 domain-containing protein [Bacteroidales bacterium]